MTGLMCLSFPRDSESGLGTKGYHTAQKEELPTMEIIPRNIKTKKGLSKSSLCVLQEKSEKSIVQTTFDKQIRSNNTFIVLYNSMIRIMHLSCLEYAETGLGTKEQQWTYGETKIFVSDQKQDRGGSEHLQLESKYQGHVTVVKASLMFNDETLDALHITSMMHSSLPKNVDTGPDYIVENMAVDITQEATTCESNSPAQYQHALLLTEINSTKNPDQVSNPLIRLFSNDCKTVIMNMLCFQEFEKSLGSTKKNLDKNTCLKTLEKGEQKFITSPPNVTVQTETCLPVYNSFMAVITHLYFAKGVDNIAGIKEEPPDLEVHAHIHERAKKATPSMLEHDQNLEVAQSRQLKGEPPDAPCINNPAISKESRQMHHASTYQGKALNSQRRMKANLLSLGADCIVSRSKLFQGGGYDEDIRTTPYLEPINPAGTKPPNDKTYRTDDEEQRGVPNLPSAEATPWRHSRSIRGFPFNPGSHRQPSHPAGAYKQKVKSTLGLVWSMDHYNSKGSL